MFKLIGVVIGGTEEQQEQQLHIFFIKNLLQHLKFLSHYYKIVFFYKLLANFQKIHTHFYFILISLYNRLCSCN